MQTRSSSRFLIKLIAICFSVIVTSISISGVDARAQSTDVMIEAEAGFSGYAKEGMWIPVRIKLENKGADINEASLQVSYRDFNNIASVFSADVTLPANSRKEFFIYVYYPQGGVANLNVELIASNKAISKTKARVSGVAPQSLMIGLMTGTPSNYSGLSQVTPQNGITRLVEITPASLPDKSEGWESLDAIILADLDTGVLTSAQRKALELWIAKGGILFTIGGPKWQSTVQGVQELLPIQVNGTTTVISAPDMSAFHSAIQFSGFDIFPEEAESVLATGRPAKDAQVVATQGDVALVLVKTLGKGKSIFFAADPGLAPYKNWSGTYLIFDYLLNFKHQRAAWVNGKWDIASANESISSIGELAIPSILIICGLMGFYIVMVGPVNYIFLRVINKREWAWATIPVIVILITAVSYIYGYFYRGNTPALSRLTVIQAWDGVSQAQKDTLVGIYSPQRETYTLESENGALLYPFNAEDTNLKSDTSWLSTQDGQSTNAPQIPVEIGGMKVIGSTGIAESLQLDHDLTISFVNGSAVIDGTVTNNSKTTITGLNLVTPSRWKALGDLAPGESRNANLSLTTTINSPEFFYDGAAAILQTNFTQLQTDADLRRKEAFLRSVITTEYGESNANWGIYLIGWLEESPASATLKDSNTKNTDTTIYIHQVSPALPEPSEEFTLTTAMFEWQSSSDDTSPYYAYSYSNSEFTLRFRPALPISFSRVEQLKLNLDSYTLPTASEVSLWNLTLNDWEVMQNVNWGTYNVTNPESYVSKAGEVSLRIKSIQNAGYVEMSKSNISLVVSP